MCTWYTIKNVKKYAKFVLPITQVAIMVATKSCAWGECKNVTR